MWSSPVDVGVTDYPLPLDVPSLRSWRRTTFEGFIAGVLKCGLAYFVRDTSERLPRLDEQTRGCRWLFIQDVSQLLREVTHGALVEDGPLRAWENSVGAVGEDVLQQLRLTEPNVCLRC